MRDADYAPAPDVRPWVDRYWSLEDASPGADPQCVLPDGHPEWVVHLGEPFEGQGSCLAIGQMTGPVYLRAAGPVRVFGVRFRPEGAFAFTGADQSEMANRIVEGPAAWREQVGNGEPVAATDAMLRRLLRIEWNARITAAVDLLVAGESVDRAAAACNWSPRQLERTVVARTGLPPKMLARLGRFQRALWLREQGLGWASVAADAGFADQSHLVRDFRQFAGAPPSSLVRSALTEAMLR